MLLLLAMAALQPGAGQCTDPDESTSHGQRLLGAGEPCKARQAYPAVRGPAPPALKAAIRAYFDDVLLDGPSARWKWLPVRGDGAVYCGLVNAKNRLGAYTGYEMFAVRRVGSQIVDHEVGPGATIACGAIYP